MPTEDDILDATEGSLAPENIFLKKAVGEECLSSTQVP